MRGNVDRTAPLRAHVEELARAHVGRGFAGDDTDLWVLQAILDANVLAPSDVDELESLGAVLGDRLLEAMDGFTWAIVEDEYGRDPVIRYRETSLALSPLNMISKRIEDGEAVDVVNLFRLLIVETLKICNQIG